MGLGSPSIRSDAMTGFRLVGVRRGTIHRELEGDHPVCGGVVGSALLRREPN